MSDSIAKYYAPFLFFAVTVAVGVTRASLKAKRMKTKNIYYETLTKADGAYAAMQGKKQKSFAYGTVIFVPEKSAVDFGQPVWPPAFIKKESSPRVLLVSTWTTGKLALPGGRAKNKGEESPLENMNREFAEETGCSTINFDDGDYVFSKIEIKPNGKEDQPSALKLSHYFVKIVRDEAKFNQMVVDFHGDTKRKGFVDEIFGTVAVPLWVEAPINPADICWENNCWGFPRLLTSGTFREKEDLIVMLMTTKGIISEPLMRRVFALANTIDKQNRSETMAKRMSSGLEWFFGETSHVLPLFDTFMKAPGLVEVVVNASSSSATYGVTTVNNSNKK